MTYRLAQRFIVVAISIAVAAGVPKNLLALEYNIVPIAITDGTLAGVEHRPAIDASGAVYFVGNYNFEGFVLERGTGFPNPPTRLVDSGTFYVYSRNFDVNANGDVAFGARQENEESHIYTLVDGALTQIDNSSGYFGNVGSAINNELTAAYSTSAGVFTTLDPNNPLDGFTDPDYEFGEMAAINSAGDIAYWVTSSGAYDPQLRLALFGGPTITIADNTIADNSGFNIILESLDLNDQGMIAFAGWRKDDVLGAFIWQNDVTSVKVNIAGTFEADAQATLAINNHGDIVFRGTLGATDQTGLFSGGNPATDTIVVAGDAVAGTTIEEIEFGRGFNDAGRIAFWARLADGRRGIFRADPVPEPSTLALAGIGALALLACGFRHRISIRRFLPRGCSLTRCIALPLILLSGLSCISTTIAQAAQYQFTRIVDDTGLLTSFGPNPTIDAAGGVVFTAYSADGLGIYRGNGGAVETVYTGNAPTVSPNWSPVTNESGVVAFASLDSKTGLTSIYRTAGGTPDLKATFAAQFFSNNLRVLSINDDETIAYGEGREANNIYTTLNPSIPVLNADDAGFRDFSPNTSINDLGQIAITGNRVFNQNFTDTVMVLDPDGQLTIVADSSGPFSLFSRFADINDSGAVAFVAANDFTSLQDLYVGIYRWHDGNLSLLGDSTAYGFGLDFERPPFVDINNVGGAAFLADTGDVSGLPGIFTGPDPNADRVIGSGDPLDGSSVTFTQFFRGLNDPGQIAFYAVLDDGRTGIYRADPIPEPSTLALAGIGALALLVAGGRTIRRAR